MTISVRPNKMAAISLSPDTENRAGQLSIDQTLNHQQPFTPLYASRAGYNRY